MKHFRDMKSEGRASCSLRHDGDRLLLCIQYRLTKVMHIPFPSKFQLEDEIGRSQILFSPLSPGN